MSRLIVCCSTHRSLASAVSGSQEEDNEQQFQATFSLANAESSNAKQAVLSVRSPSNTTTSSTTPSCCVVTLPFEAEEAEVPPHLGLSLSSAVQPAPDGDGNGEPAEPRTILKADIALSTPPQDAAHPTDSIVCVSQEVFAIGADVLAATADEGNHTALSRVYKRNVNVKNGEAQHELSFPEGSSVHDAPVTVYVSVFCETSDAPANALSVEACSKLLDTHLSLVQSLPAHASAGGAVASANKEAADGLEGFASELEQVKQENASLRERIQAVEEQRVQDIGNLRHEIVELRQNAIQHESQLEEESDRGRRIALLAAARADPDTADHDAQESEELPEEDEEVAEAVNEESEALEQAEPNGESAAAAATAAAEIPNGVQEEDEHPVASIEPNSNVHEVTLGSLTDAAAVESAEPAAAEEEPRDAQNIGEPEAQPADFETEHSGEVTQYKTESLPQPHAAAPVPAPTPSAVVSNQRLWDTAPTPAVVSRTNRRTLARSTQPQPEEGDTDSTRTPTARTFATPRQGQIQPRTTRALSPVVKVRSSLSGVSYDNSYYKTNPDTMQRLQRLHRLDNSVDRLQQNKRSHSATKWSRSESTVQTGLPAAAAAAHNAPAADAHAPVYAIGDEPPASTAAVHVTSTAPPVPSPANGERASVRGVRPAPTHPIESSRRVPSSLVKSNRTVQSPTSTPIKRRTLDGAVQTPLRKRATSPLLSVRPREAGKAANQTSTPAKETPRPAPHGVHRSTPQKLYRIASPPQHVETRKSAQPTEKVAV